MAGARATKRKPKRGRPVVAKFSPLAVTVEAAAVELSTLDGITRRRAELYLRARTGGTALELEYQRLERGLLRESEHTVRAAETIASTERLAEQLAKMERQLAGRTGSALRADMAPAPPPQRGKRTLQ